MFREICSTMMISESYTLLDITLLYTMWMRRLNHISQVPIYYLLIKYYLGIDGSEGITAMAISPSRKNIAICERAERAVCIIYDISGLA